MTLREVHVFRCRCDGGSMDMDCNNLRAALAETPPAAAGEGRHCEGCDKTTCGAAYYAHVAEDGGHPKCPGIPAAQPAVSEEELDNIDEILKHDHSHWNKNYDAYRRMQILGATVARLRGEGK